MIKRVIILGLFLVVITRIVYLYNKRDYYNDLLNAKTNLYVKGPSAPRGRILDINGKVIVDNKAVKTIFYHRNTNSNDLAVAYKLATLINVPLDDNEVSLKKYYYLNHQNEIDKSVSPEIIDSYNKRKISSKKLLNIKLNMISKEKIDSLTDTDKKASYIYNIITKGYSYQNIIIKKDVLEEEYANVIESNIPGIFGDITWDRYYPYEDTLKSILGSVGPISREDKDKYLDRGYQIGDIVGVSYLEKEYEEFLKGKKAVYKVLEDNSLKLVSKEEKGNDIVLNIDIDVQLKLDEILKNSIIKAKKEINTGYYKESYVVISDPITGEIIALSGQRYLNDTTFSDVSTNIVNTSYTVGSVVKGATITVGYNNHLIDENTRVYDSCIKLYLNPVKCSYKRLGYLNDITALKESSNYFQFLIAIGLTGNKYYPNIKLNVEKKHFDIYRNILADYGLGVLSGIDLPNEKEGIKGSIVSDDLLLNLAIGQYDTYTPIMLSTYINTIASNGYVKKPALLNKVVSNGEVIYEKKADPIRKVTIEDKYLDRIRKGFNLVTTEGTARGYITDKVSSGGKTGTSESFYDSDNDGKADSKTISTAFVGFFPFENPKYSITIVSPNISNYKNNDTYISRVNKYISSDISVYLFDIGL